MNQNAFPTCNGPLRSALAPKAYQLGLTAVQSMAKQPGSIADRVAESRNFLTSPVCLNMALVTAAAGAAGHTLDDILDVLCVSHKANLREISDTIAAISDGVSTATRAVSQRGLPLQRGFAATMATLGGTMHHVNFADTEKARHNLDNWVYRNTKGLIPTSGITVTADTVIVLQSVMTLTASWEEPFPVNNTEDTDFFLMSGERSRCRMMSLTHNLLYGEYEGWRATTLPYVGGVSCDIIVPPEGASPLKATPGIIIGALQAVKESSRLPLTVKLPRIHTSSSDSLRSSLGCMGLASLFENADFSAMSPQVKGIDDYVQQVILDVDEHGTQAAAAVEMMSFTSARIGARTPHPPLTCDHPFLLVIRDETTDVPVYMGAIHKPDNSEPDNGAA